MKHKPKQSLKFYEEFSVITDECFMKLYELSKNINRDNIVFIHGDKKTFDFIMKKAIKGNGFDK